MLKKLEQEANYVAPGDNQVYPSHLSPKQHTRGAQLVGNKCSVNCHLDGKAVTALWDTGAQVSIVSETFMHKQSLTSKLRNVEELLGVQGKIELKAANGTPIPYCGWIELSVRLNETQPDILVPFLVTKENIGPPIIGFNVIELIVKEANTNEPDDLYQVKCRKTDILIPKNQSIDVPCRANTGPINRTVPVLFEPIDNTELPSGLLLQEELKSIKQGNCSLMNVKITNQTNHDIILPGRTVVGHLQLVPSVTPIEVKLKEPKATTNQHFDQTESKECDNVSAENLPPVDLTGLNGE
ncbi:Retrovirus-related Pol poly from transposon [Paramuricea clavata]|uniref:Retrovirus-related Pol poly from transposon n=1 Tax=Paramuricea clavata TaxID=317549 RepID=A0A6S7I422_PARCT|nr:Retrovirus-related Pol poly from transposon [Paramuricea clavata]